MVYFLTGLLILGGIVVAICLLSNLFEMLLDLLPIIGGIAGIAGVCFLIGKCAIG